MGNRIRNQKNRGYINAKQNYKAYRDRGDIGERSSNLVRLIGAERVSRREYNYEGTYYVTEDGEVYDKEYVDSKKAQRTGVSYYEITEWEYNCEETKKLHYPSVRRIVIIKNTNKQLSLDL